MIGFLQAGGELSRAIAAAAWRRPGKIFYRISFAASS